MAWFLLFVWEDVRRRNRASSKTVLLDAGPLIGLFNSDDNWHQVCVDFFGFARYEYITTIAVLTEVLYRIQKARSASQAAQASVSLLEDVSIGIYRIHSLSAKHFSRIKELRLGYDDKKIDFADLTLVVAAEELGHGRIVTLDTNDFETLRWQGKKSFTIVGPKT